jgi:hypothetical protein
MKSGQTILTLIFSVLVIFNAISQEPIFIKPDYDLIKKEIQDQASLFYYPTLISRLRSYDTTLTKEEYRHLYYGYIYDKNYEPYWRSPYEKDLSVYYRNENINEHDYDKIIDLATKSIDEFPFDLRQMNFMGYIYHLKGDEEMAKKVTLRFHGIIGALLSTGDGKTCETGFHVISTSHEYVVLNMFQFQSKSQSLVGRDCDYIALTKDERNIDGMYFDIKKLFEMNRQKFKR